MIQHGDAPKETNRGIEEKYTGTEKAIITNNLSEVSHHDHDKRSDSATIRQMAFQARHFNFLHNANIVVTRSAGCDG